MAQRIGRRIGVLMGGLSSERDLSIKTGDAVHAALVDRGHDAVKIFVDRDLDLSLRAERIELAYLALHGRYGEDGSVQGLLELFGIPYTGSSVLASALATDKLKAKELFRLHNLPTPSYYLHRRGEGSASAQHGSFGYPAVVKPRAEGSSLGVARASDRDELESAVEAALCFDDHVLVERCIAGCEVHVALLGDRLIGAIEVASEGVYDFSARRGARPIDLFIPPRLSTERLRGVATIAGRAARALEASGLVEVDLIVSPSGNEYVLEVDTQPALSPDALVPKIAHAAGVEFAELVEAVLADARLNALCRQSRHERRLYDLPWQGAERRSAASETH